MLLFMWIITQASVFAILCDTKMKLRLLFVVIWEKCSAWVSPFGRYSQIEGVNIFPRRAQVLQIGIVAWQSSLKSAQRRLSWSITLLRRLKWKRSELRFDLKYILKQLLINIEASLTQLWSKFETALKQFQSNFEATIEASWSNFGTILKQVWSNFFLQFIKVLKVIFLCLIDCNFLGSLVY